MSKVSPKAARRVLEAHSAQFTECVHCWLIDTPTGGQYSHGRCLKCGAERADFANWVERDFFRDAETAMSFRGSYR